MFDDQSNDALALLLMPFHEADSEITALTLGLPPESEKRRNPLIESEPEGMDGGLGVHTLRSPCRHVLQPSKPQLQG